MLLGPFGEPLRATGTSTRANPFRFSTHYTDEETGLVYAKRRYYQPATGRWLSWDPIGIRGGLNLYGYVRNDSVNLFDPFGKEPKATKCEGVCGASIDDWVADEIRAQLDGWSRWKRQNGGKATISDYLKWANGNQRYKDADNFQFSKGVDGCGTQPDPSKPGCGRSVTLCGNCVRSSILGNVMYGLIGRYAGFSDDELKKGASGTKENWGLEVDPYDEIAYDAGADIYGSGFEEPLNVGNLCQRVNDALSANPGALNEGDGKGGYNDLSSCKPCTKKTKEGRHGGNDEPRKLP